MAKTTIISARRARRTKTVAGRSVTRRAVNPGEGKPAAAKRKTGKSTATTASTRAPSARREKAVVAAPTKLRFERVTGKIKLTPPPGYMLSVLLKLIDRDGTDKIYAWWLAVGRYGLDVSSAPFDIDGADVIRCDVPENFDFSTSQISEGLSVFVKGDKEELSKLGGGGDVIVIGPGGTRPSHTN